MQKFDEKAALNTCGLQNTGVICYLNSFLQSVMSCTSVNKYFFDNEDRFIDEKNTVAIEYIKLLKKVRDTPGHSNVFASVGILRAIILETTKKYPNKCFGDGQEDSGEGLTLFLDSIDDPGLYKFFMHKYVSVVWCLICEKNVSSNKDEACILEVPPRLKPVVMADEENPDPNQVKIDQSHILNRHIHQYKSDLKGYKCPECKQEQCCKVYQLAGAPEIMIVMFNKFFNKSNIDFPGELYFLNNSKTNPIKTFKLVSKIEHSGGRNGGHYWAHCYRKGAPESKVSTLEPLELLDDTDESLSLAMEALGLKNPSIEDLVSRQSPLVVCTPTKQDSLNNQISVYNLNDTRISSGDFIPTHNTYILFYHHY